MTEAPPPARSHQLSSAATNGPVEVLPGHVTEVPSAHCNLGLSTASQVPGGPVGVAPDGSALHSFAASYSSQVSLREVARAGTPPSRASPQRQQYQQQQHQLPNKVLATPELKPASLSVPLPSAPLTANILDSLDGVADKVGSGKEDPLKPASLVAGRARAVLSKSPATLLTGGNPVAGGDVKGVALQTQQQHLQKVIEVQRTQLALLQEIFAKNSNKPKEGVAKSTSGGRYQVQPLGLPPSAASGSHGHVTSVECESGGGATAASVVDRTQTFDYGNHSNKTLEFRAARQLEKDSYYGGKDGRWP